MNLEESAKQIQDWHGQAFPWAGIREIARKRQEEAKELAAAVSALKVRS